MYFSFYIFLTFTLCHLTSMISTISHALYSSLFIMFQYIPSKYTTFVSFLFCMISFSHTSLSIVRVFCDCQVLRHLGSIYHLVTSKAKIHIIRYMNTAIHQSALDMSNIYIINHVKIALTHNAKKSSVKRKSSMMINIIPRLTHDSQKSIFSLLRNNFYLHLI